MLLRCLRVHLVEHGEAGIGVGRSIRCAFTCYRQVDQPVVVLICGFAALGRLEATEHISLWLLLRRLLEVAEPAAAKRIILRLGSAERILLRLRLIEELRLRHLRLLLLRLCHEVLLGLHGLEPTGGRPLLL